MLLPPRIQLWLNNRGISNAIISESNLSWDGARIVIPICDPAGNFLFNKYRRDPASVESPKYTYDKGATSELYRAHLIHDAVTVIITEGELDALRLATLGYAAVSTTGGAGTFKNEWLPLLVGKNVYVCYDNDEAGMKGAVKVLTKIPAWLIMLPHEREVKDITDFLKKYRDPALKPLMEKAERFPILCELIPEVKTIRTIQTQIKKYRTAADDLWKKEHRARRLEEPWSHYAHIREHLYRIIDERNTRIKQIQYARRSANVHGNANSKITEDQIRWAKETPLRLLLEVNHTGFAHCPFHEDKTPSLRVYKVRNRWWCFSCASGSDTIDFIRKRDGCDFTTAVKKLLNA